MQECVDEGIYSQVIIEGTVAKILLILFLSGGVLFLFTKNAVLVHGSDKRKVLDKGTFVPKK